MCTYGGDSLEFLKDAIESTLGAEGSGVLLLGIEEPLPEDTRIYLDSLADNPRLKLKRYPHRYGFAPVLNDLIEASIGDPTCEFIFRMDSDDICLKDRFVRQEAYFKDNPVVDVLGGCAVLIDENGQRYGEVRKVASHARMKRMLPIDSPLLHPTVAFRASVLRKGFRYPTNIVCEDLAFWATLLEAGIVFGNIQEHLLEYRQTRSTYTRRKGFAQGWPAMTVRLKYIWKVMPFRVDLALLVIGVTFAKALVPASLMGKLYGLRAQLIAGPSRRL
ncbi:MAG: glycosyltransferase [Steroidobacteraceae bacterium]